MPNTKKRYCSPWQPEQEKPELIGMAEYAVYKYIPRCLENAKDIEGILTSFVPLLESIDVQDAKILARQLKEVSAKISPYMPCLRKKKHRSKEEILAQNQVKKVERQCREELEKAFQEMTNGESAKEIKRLVGQNIINIYDYNFVRFDVNELSGGYFANLLGIMKHGTSYPLFDEISSDVVGSVIDKKKLDLSNLDQEILRHAGVATNILMTLPTLDSASVDEILDFKKDLKNPLDNFRKAVYGFSERIKSLPWDDDFKYECLKLYYTEVFPSVEEINELSSETSVLKNFGRKVLEDEEVRKKLGYIGVGLVTSITTGPNISFALGVIENLLRMGATIGLSAAGVDAFLKTSDLMKQAYKESEEKKSEIKNNVMYYYYKASKKIK